MAGISDFFATLWSFVPGWDQLCDSLGLGLMLFLGKIEHFWEGLPVWKPCIWVSQLVEVGVKQTAQWRWSHFGVILQELGNKVNSFSRGAMSEHLLPRKWSNLGESVLLVVRIHGLNALLRWSSKNLDNFD